MSLDLHKPPRARLRPLSASPLPSQMPPPRQTPYLALGLHWLATLGVWVGAILEGGRGELGVGVVLVLL